MTRRRPIDRKAIIAWQEKLHCQLCALGERESRSPPAAARAARRVRKLDLLQINEIGGADRVYAPYDPTG
jgi:hypothetical protein